MAKKALTITDATAQNKLYDGNATATLTGTLAGMVSPDSVTLTLSGTFADANPGTSKPVTSTSTIDVLSLANYTLTQPTGLTANIVAFTWTNLVGGNWSVAGNWLDNLIGDGVGTTSYFSTLDLTADTTVHLDSPRTAGALIFGDTDTGTAAAWLLDNGGTPANTLTLAGTTPTITVNALGSGKSVTIGAVVAGTAGLIKNGAGTLTLSAVNAYTGATNVNAGTLEVAAGGVINNAGPINAVSGGAMNISGTVDVTNGVLAVGSSTAGTGTMNILPGAVVNVGNGAQASNVYVGGKINNTGNAGVGILNISGTLNVPAGGTGVNGDGGALWLNGYGRSGNSTINLDSGGLLNTARVVAEGALPKGSIFNFDGGTLKSTYTGGSILASSIYNVRNGGAVIDSAGADISLSEVLQHSSIGGDHAIDGGLTKTGNGKLTLSAVNTYTGNTTVNAGTLSITHACLADASTVTIASAAKLDLNFGAVSDTVAKLIIGSTPMATGVYGGTGSAATTIDDTHFSGVGTLTVTSGGSLYDTWANGTFANGATLSDKSKTGDPDSDGLSNMLEYAFGTDPTVSSSAEIAVSGASVTPGAPKIVSDNGSYYIEFGRRKDYVAAGLTYTVEFTAGLDLWGDNDDNANPPESMGATDGTIDAMRVMFPPSVHVANGDPKPTFARVRVVMAP